MIGETVGQRLRRVRRERGFTQRELAEPGVSHAFISRVESGDRVPSVKALRKLAARLGVTADYLETGVETVRIQVTPHQIDEASRAWAGADALTWDELTAEERCQVSEGLEEALVDSLAARVYAVQLNRSPK